MAIKTITMIFVKRRRQIGLAGNKKQDARNQHYRLKKNQTPEQTKSTQESTGEHDQSPLLSSELSSLSLNSNHEDELTNQIISEPKDGQLITSSQWVPIATSSAPKNRRKKHRPQGTTQIFLDLF
ncbi:hypothetical protein KEM48_004728 [Puccinia striiformis f. sp. tritici PST-130]|nr:hypothetical protein KEM48_004728 [Puccinia striiformis f. sp. tritici PST-130]